MEIIVDFYTDFIKLNLKVINELKSQGFQFEEYDDWKRRKGKIIINILSSKKPEEQETDLIDAYEKDLVFSYANWVERIPDFIPRTIHKCKNFLCPEQYQVGLSLLEEKIRKGDNLIPFLSRQIEDARKNDRMLFVLGITHFHLGTKQTKKKPLLIEGTSDILYAFIHNNDCYFIIIDKHGRWDDEELLRLLNDDFPEVLSRWKLNGVTPVELTDNQRKVLRRNNLTTLITINNEGYMPPGWGTSTAGTSINARMKLDRFMRYLDKLEKNLVLLLNEQHERLELDFNRKINSMILSLSQTDPIRILDKENNLIIDVTSFDGDNLSVHITNKNLPNI